MISRWTVCLASLLLAAPFACGGDEADPAAGDDAGRDGGGASSGTPSSSGNTSNDGGSSSGGNAVQPCPRSAPADAAPHFMVASRPAAVGGGNSNRYSVWSLSAAGAVADVADFEMSGSSSLGKIAFSNDGKIGAVAFANTTGSEGGAIGVFRLGDDGTPTVVHAAYKSGEMFADQVKFSPDGAYLYVVEAGIPANGGGVSVLPVGCDGTLGEPLRATSSRAASMPFWLPGNSRALLAGDEMQNAGNDAFDLHLFDLAGNQATRVSSATVFGQSTLIGDGAVSADGKYALLGANAEYVGGLRLIAAHIDGDTLTRDAEWPLTAGPDVVLASPYGNAFFFTTGFEPDAAWSMTYSATGEGADAEAGSAVFGKPTQLTYATGHGRPQLVNSGGVITRGALRGRIVVGEVAAIRQFQFEANGTVRDVAKQVTSTGDDASGMLGAFAVTP